MFSSVVHRMLLSRSGNCINFSQSFNKQAKKTRWFLQQSGDTSIASAEASSKLGPKCLVKPFLFTVSFSGACFLGATIWQYEEMRKLSYRFNQSFFDRHPNAFKMGELRKRMNYWWYSLGEGQKIATAIIAVNVGVFLLWRIKSLQPFMTQYFCASPARVGSCLPMVLSTFSHYNFWHLAANMYVLFSFSNTAVAFFGKEQFLAFYGSAGVISSFTSYAYKVFSGRLVTSLGASGALMAVLSSMCYQFPSAPLQIIFLPFFTFSAGHAIKAVMALDFIGLIAKWKLFDHAAHLGGAICGILYVVYGREYLWDKREPIFKWYHSIRERKKD